MKKRVNLIFWKKLGDIQRARYLEKKLFLRKKIYSLNMEDKILVVDRLNIFNMIVS